MAELNSCDNWIERFLDGDFKEQSPERIAFESHLSSCAKCSELYEKCSKMDAVIHALPLDEPPSTLSMVRTLMENEMKSERQERGLVPFAQNGHERPDAGASVTTVGESVIGLDAEEFIAVRQSAAFAASLEAQREAHVLKIRTFLAITTMVVFVASAVFSFLYVVLLHGSPFFLGVPLPVFLPMYWLLRYYFPRTQSSGSETKKRQK